MRKSDSFCLLFFCFFLHGTCPKYKLLQQTLIYLSFLWLWKWIMKKVLTVPNDSWEGRWLEWRGGPRSNFHQHSKPGDSLHDHQAFIIKQRFAQTCSWKWVNSNWFQQLTRYNWFNAETLIGFGFLVDGSSCWGCLKLGAANLVVANEACFCLLASTCHPR